MAQEQTPKRWTGLAKIVKIIEKPDNYYFWVRVTKDLHGDSEFLEGACSVSYTHLRAHET